MDKAHQLMYSPGRQRGQVAAEGADGQLGGHLQVERPDGGRPQRQGALRLRLGRPAARRPARPAPRGVRLLQLLIGALLPEPLQVPPEVSPSQVRSHGLRLIRRVRGRNGVDK